MPPFFIFWSDTWSDTSIHMYYRACCGQLKSCPLKPPLGPRMKYYSLMNKNTMLRVFVLEFDISTEGYNNVWEAHSAMVKTGRLHPTEDVVSVAPWGYAPNGWPILSVKFASLEAAKAYTLAYLGYDENSYEHNDAVAIDDEINEYIQYGKFVDA